MIRNGVKPTIIDTGHYLQRLAPSENRGAVISINARKIFNMLGLEDELNRRSSYISYFSRSDDMGKPFGSVNFKQMEFIHKLPTTGIGQLELEKILYDEVARHVPIRSGATVSSIKNVTQNSEPKVVVDYHYKNANKGRIPESDVYDVVVISDGTFSATRKLLWPEEIGIRGLCNMYEVIMDRPKDLPLSHYVDMWGEGRRFGYYPVNSKQLYVYGQLRKGDSKEFPAQRSVSPTEFINSFKGFGGGYPIISKEMSSASHCTETISLFSAVSKLHQGRVVCMGNAAFTTPTPCNGHDIAIAVNSAYFLATALLLRVHSVDSVLKKYEMTNSTYDYLIGTYSNDIATAVVNKSPLGSWARNIYLKFSNSDSKLTSRETQFLRSSNNDMANQIKNKNMIEIMRQEYMSLTEEQRKSLIQSFEERKKAMNEELNKQ